MSMDNDTRLAMMSLNNNEPARRAPRRARRATSHARRMAAPTAASIATFALTLFTRGA